MEKLHLRAADWYQSNGSPAMAVEHLLDTTEGNRCVQLVTELVLLTYQSGQISAVQRWLSAVGDPAIEDYPPLAVLAGWITALAGQTAKPNAGRRSPTPRRSTWCHWMAPRRSTRRGPCCGP
jgi:LuxR family transcriptional regulator, maltose regulon positive regulatory protein